MKIMPQLQVLAVNIQRNQPLLFVLKGFTADFFKEIQENKLLDAPLNLTIQQLDVGKPRYLPQLFNKLEREFFWCTYEEYLAVGSEILRMYFHSVVVANNLFDRMYPALYELQVDERTMEWLRDEEAELPESGAEPMELIYRYYGGVKKIGERLFVAYPDADEEQIPFYLESAPLTSRNVSDEHSIELELSEDEDGFLQLELDVLEGRVPPGEILLAITGDLNATPHRYVKRLQALQGILDGRYTICLVQKRTESKPNLNAAPYVSVLQRYWGYSDFRKLKMYRNIQSQTGDKSTTEISQAQIVNDIVQEALKAKAGKDYQDVFVTSPTGAGKSVMFQVPAIYLAEQHQLMTIVISPLIGLMNDQVQGLIENHVSMSATINSEISPVEKMEISERIRQGHVSILYISPETLLSRSDISQLIGDRQVGLFVIDEAHIVTTWGKAFRSDYWYLGTYLSKLRKAMNFPIATFTATAIYGGVEDMYVETRDSLNMITPISYFGYIRRDDLDIVIRRKLDYDKKFNEYLMDKNKLLLNKIERFIQEDSKTLVYFPTVKAILDFREFVRMYGSESAQEKVAVYFGPLQKEQKQENYWRFKNNNALVMLATKAFGMGIDIPDIRNVYHFAPTGNVCDYIQEIGRAARALERGYAYFDFLPQDFVHVKRLHGISTIKKGQLIQVMRKILAISDEHKGSNVRNMLIRADEFRYIFQESSAGKEDNDFDNKIKTALLIIEKDFQAKLTYSPIVARPRSIFAEEFFSVSKEAESAAFPKYRKYFKLESNFGGGKSSVYRIDMKGIWQDYYPSMTFPEFKYQFHSNETRVKLPFKGRVSPLMQVILHLKQENADQFKTMVNMWVKRINVILGRYAKTKEYFAVSDLAAYLQTELGGSKYASETLAEVILNSCYTLDRLNRQSNNFYNRFLAYDDTRGKYHLLGSGYSSFTDWMVQEAGRLFVQQYSKRHSDQDYEVYFPKVFGAEQEKRFIFLGLMEALGLLVYRVNGGDNPEIFVRLNSRTQLERTVNNPSKYRNRILENVHQRHQLSVAMLRYIFENQVDTPTFWDLIEDYFLGRVPDEILTQLG